MAEHFPALWRRLAHALAPWETLLQVCFASLFGVGLVGISLALRAGRAGRVVAWAFLTALVGALWVGVLVLLWLGEGR